MEPAWVANDRGFQKCVGLVTGHVSILLSMIDVILQELM